MELSEDQMTQWFRHFGINANVDHKPHQIHASGHASGPEILEMIKKINPRKVIPIHTKHPGLFKAKDGETIIPVKAPSSFSPKSKPDLP